LYGRTTEYPACLSHQAGAWVEAAEALMDPGTAVRLAEVAFDRWDRQTLPREDRKSWRVPSGRRSISGRGRLASVSLLKPPA
jgi:hypothetical protein